MKKQCRPLLFIIINIVTIFNLLCYTSIRSMWSGIIRYTIEPMPYILLIIIAFCALLHTLLTINRKYPVFFAGVFVIVNLVFLALNGFIISLTLDASMYFIREFLYSGAFFLVIGIIFWASNIFNIFGFANMVSYSFIFGPADFRIFYSI